MDVPCFDESNCNKTYEKTFASQNNFDKNLPEKIRPPAVLAMKDEYAFGFLELADEHSYGLFKAVLFYGVVQAVRSHIWPRGLHKLSTIREPEPKGFFDKAKERWPKKALRSVESLNSLRWQ